MIRAIVARNSGKFVLLPLSYVLVWYGYVTKPNSLRTYALRNTDLELGKRNVFKFILKTPYES